MPYSSSSSSHWQEHTVTVSDGIEIACLKGGEGSQALVLVHGYPQTRYIYHKIADELVAAGFTVIVPDLRGYGRSSKPKGTESHVEYSKREMANDIVQLAEHFGLSHFGLVAHDRGARVAHRLCLDHPQAVSKLILLDICPTLFMYENTDRDFLLPNAEEMIAGNPKAYFSTATRGVDFGQEAYDDYFKHFSSPEGIHGSCEDYRAAATIDLEHDSADREAGRKLQVKELRVLWGKQGLIPKYGDVLDVWRSYSSKETRVDGRAVDSDHYIPENADRELLKEILDLFKP